MAPSSLVVVVGICTRLRDNDIEIYVQQRPFDAREYPGRWELPGGKRERGECTARTIDREWLEETGHECLTVGPVVATASLDLTGGEALLVIHPVRCPALEESGTWVTPQRLRQLDATPATPTCIAHAYECLDACNPL